jgi:hypothetical protein
MNTTTKTARLPSPLRLRFNMQSLKTKGLTLLIEHSPCCILSFGAAMIGVPFLRHNPVIELGFAIGGAIVGEHIGHKYFHKHTGAHDAHGHSHEKEGWRGLCVRYGLALTFGLASWGVHQVYFHDHGHHHDHAETAVLAAPAAPRTQLARNAP